MTILDSVLRALSSSKASPRRSTNDKLKSLSYPLERAPFPLYQGDEWRGILDFEGNICGGEYWGKAGNVFESHSHDFVEHGIIFSGSCILYTEGEKPVHLHTGNQFKINPSIHHEVHWIEDTVLIMRWEPPLKLNWTWDRSVNTLVEEDAVP